MTTSAESRVWPCLQSSKKGNLSLVRRHSLLLSSSTLLAVVCLVRGLRSTDSCRERVMSKVVELKKLVKDLQSAIQVQSIMS